MAIKKAKTNKKIIKVEDRGGAKTVAKKASFVAWTKRIFAVFTILWLGGFAYSGWHVKENYTTPIKESMVVSIFFDLQKDISGQYADLMDGLKDSINMEKPIKKAFAAIEISDSITSTVSDTTKKVSNTTSSVKKITSIAGKFGVDTGSVDNVVSKTDNTVAAADSLTAKINSELDRIEKDLIIKTQVEVDVMIDTTVNDLIKKNTGSLGRIMLTNYGVEKVSPVIPSSWDVASKIYKDLEASKISVVETIIATVNTYFGYVFWGLLITYWLIGLLVWLWVRGKVKTALKPFIVCPRCGHAFADKRSIKSILHILTPWNWI